MKVLVARLNKREENKRLEEKASAHSDQPDTAWGLQIRSYTLQPYTVSVLY
jgi:protein subunit release factor B